MTLGLRSPVRALPLALFLLAVAGWASGASAQVRQGITGYVRDAGSGGPLAGAFIVLLDADGRRVGGTLSHGDGRFILPVPVPGRYRLLPERIGFRSTPSDEVEVMPGTITRIDLEVAAEAIALEGIDVDGGRRCDLADGVGRATLALWEEARKALAVARWTEASERFSYELRSWDRTLDPRGRRILDERSERSTHVGRHAFRAIDPEVLERDGYVAGDVSRGFDYYAPDAEILLSDAFLRTHCFEATRRDGRLGLRFEPAPGRTVPDVEGILWMADGSTRLERLEYRYVNVADLDEAGIGGRFGGEVRFEELPAGEWIVRWWEIRMPVLVRRMNLDRPPRPVLQVAEVKARGGEVEEVRTLGGAPLSASRSGEGRGPEPGSIRGLVVDSTAGAERFVGAGGAPVAEAAGAPLRDARIHLSGTAVEGSSGRDGRFVLDGVREGVYTVVLEHPRLAQLGVGPRRMLVEVRPGEQTAADLAIPSLTTLVAEACAAVGSRNEEEPGAASLGGVVRTRGIPVERLRVIVEWAAESGEGIDASTQGAVAEIMPDPLGRWGICAVPNGHGVRVLVRNGEGSTDPIELGRLGRGESRWLVVEAPVAPEGQGGVSPR